MYTYGTSSREKLLTVDSKLRELAIRALAESKYDISIIDGLRTTEQQQELFAKGASEADGVMRLSAHQSGRAIDVLPWVAGKDMWDYSDVEVRAIWAEVHRAFMRTARLMGLPIEMGVTYTMKDGSYDYPHIQLG